MIPRLARRLTVYQFRQQVTGLLVLLLCGVLFAAALLIPMLYRGVIVDSAQAAFAGDRYSVVLPDGVEPEQSESVRRIATLPTTITSGSGAALGISHVSDSPGFFLDFGVTLQQSSRAGDSGDVGAENEAGARVGLSRQAAAAAGVAVGDDVTVAPDTGDPLKGRLVRIFSLPADPAAVVAVVESPAGEAGRRYTSDQDLEMFLSPEALDQALISGINTRITDVVEQTAPPRLVTVSGYGVPTVAALTVLWVLAAAVLSRPTHQGHRSSLIDAGLTDDQASRVLSLAAAWSALAALVLGLLSGVAVAVLSAPALAPAVGQEWLLPRVVTTARPDASLAWLLVLVLGVAAAVVVGPQLRLPAPTSSRWPAVTAWTGAALVVLAAALLLYLWLTQGPVPGWYFAGVLTPVLAAVGVTLLVSRGRWRPGSEMSGLDQVRQTTRRRLLPLSLACVVLGTAATGTAAFLVSQSVWGTRVNTPLIEGGYIDFFGVPASGIAATDSLDLPAQGLSVSAARVTNNGPRVRVVTPDLADCYEQYVGADLFAAECFSEDPDYRSPFSEPAGLPADLSDTQVRAAPLVVRDGVVTLVISDEDFIIQRVEQRPATLDPGLGGTYTPSVTLPVTDPLVDEAGLDPEDGFSLRVSGVGDLSRLEYAGIRGELLLNASSAVFSEDLGFDDAGSYFSGVLLVLVQTLMAAAAFLALVAALRQERRSWWPLTGDLKLTARRRLQLIWPYLAPAVAGMLAGAAACAAAVTWMVNTSPLLDSRLYFLAPAVAIGLLALAQLRRLTTR